MSDSKTIRIDEELFEELAADKGDDETWTERIERYGGADARNLHAAEPLTRDDVDDIATETASRVVRDLETTLR